MHELLLHATLPPTRHHQVLSVLAGIAAMQPVPILEKHLLFKPLLQPGAPGRVNLNPQMKPMQGQMLGDLFYLKVVGEIDNGRKAGSEGKGEQDGSEMMVDGGVEAEAAGGGDGVGNDKLKNSTAIPTDPSAPTTWTLQFSDIPDAPGRRPVTSRAANDTPITGGDPVKFMKAMEYTPISTSLLRGHRLTHNAIDIRLYQLLLPPSPSSLPELLDPSGTYILQTALKVADGQNVERMQEGVRQLMELKEMLRGVVELEMVERLSLDTRVKSW